MKGAGDAVFVALVGLGPIGAGIGQILRARADVRLVAGVDIDLKKVGQDLGTVLGGAPLGVPVTDSLGQALLAHPAVAILATQSRLPDVAPLVLKLIDAGCAVVSTSEELSFPWRRYPELAADLDTRAKAKGVAVVGVGINPGYVMDLLPIVLTAPCPAVTAIRVERVVDASARRVPLQRKVGIGLTREEFDRGVASGAIGHVGLAESAAMIASALGWSLRMINESIEPVMGAERVRGLHQTLVAWVDEDPAITLDLVMAGGEASRDEIWISGPLPLHFAIVGGVHGDVATWAIAANATFSALQAQPGLHAISDLPPLRWRSVTGAGSAPNLIAAPQSMVSCSTPAKRIP